MSGYVRASLALILTVGIASVASAQTKIGGGVKGGVNFATVSGDIDLGGGATADKKMLVGAAFGGFVSVPLKEGLSFDPEVLYSMEGLKFSANVDGTNFDAKGKVGVVEIPLLIRVVSTSSSQTHGYFVVGPGVGIIVRAKQEVNGTEEDFKDQLKKADFSIIVGGGVQMSKAFVEARYIAGLTDVNKAGQSTTKNRSQVVQVLVGARF